MTSTFAPRVLICEDDFLIAQDIASCLTDLGARIVGFAKSVAKGLELADTKRLECDAALLDIDLQGEDVYPVARALLRRGIKVVFYSGYTRMNLPPDLAGAPFVAKPAIPEELLRAISEAP